MAKRAPPPVTDEDLTDAELFRRTVGKVRPVAVGRAAAPNKRKPAPRARSRIADERAALAESLAPPPPGADVDSGEGHEHRRPGIQDSVMRKLRRGQYRTEAELDLHGLTRKRAHAELVAFLAEARADGARCVRIVHGKGHGSGNEGPVLKRALAGWLHRDEVLAFTSAPRGQGGSGATLVLLRGQR